MPRGFTHALAAAFSLGFCFGCIERREMELAARTVRPPQSVIVFFADGMDHGRFEELLGRGLLPNIKARFVEGGVEVRHAFCSMPSITYPNAVSILTGRFPGHHGILGNQWFDREACLIRDYGYASTYKQVNEDFPSPTLYELLDGHFTVNVQCHTRRGVTETIDNTVVTGLDWLFHDFRGADARVGECVEQVIALANRQGQWPSVYFNYFPGLDEIGHRFGSDSAEYEAAMITVDAAIGRVLASVERTDAAAATFAVLLTDHGHVPSPPGRFVDVADWLTEKCGLRVHRGALQSGPDSLRRARLDCLDAVLINGAYRRAAIFLRGYEGWNQPADSARLRQVLQPQGHPALWEIEGIGAVCVRDGSDAVRIHTRDGTARIERRGFGVEKQYRLIDAVSGTASHNAAAGDPLGYRRSPRLAAFIEGGWHGSREWLAATAESRYPDFVPQIVEMMDSPRAGDIVVFADDEWTFEDQSTGGHGSCMQRDMRIPLFFAGPGLPRGASIPSGRLVDVMPTILEILGEPSETTGLDLDGISLLAALEAADPKSPLASSHGRQEAESHRPVQVGAKP